MRMASPMQDSDLKLIWFRRIAEIDREAWDALARPLETPFLEWDWLCLLEDSGSVSPAAGWLPHHLTVWSGERLVAAAPLYIKLHSAGEFVFDHAWAEVAGRLGRSYYPKLVGMSPFTPMIGYRFLMASRSLERNVSFRMVAEIERFCRHHGLSGCSFHFADPQWTRTMTPLGYCRWAHQSFAWKNQNYRSFDDFLARFNSNQRRNIRRECTRLYRRGIDVEMISGKELPREFHSRMYAFYTRTNDQFGPWGCKYLTRDFFTGLLDRFGHRLVFAVAFERNQPRDPVGMSLLVSKGKHLYGRYWGCAREVEFLHFNACYYRPIEWAIQNGILNFDPGMGGIHKLRRGFKAIANYSLHRFIDPVMRNVMERNMPAINSLQDEEIEALNRELPMRSLMS